MLPRDHVLQAVKRLRWLTGEYNDRLCAVADRIERREPKAAWEALRQAQRWRREHEPKVLEELIAGEQGLAKLIETLGGSDEATRA